MLTSIKVIWVSLVILATIFFFRTRDTALVKVLKTENIQLKDQNNKLKNTLTYKSNSYNLMIKSLKDKNIIKPVDGYNFIKFFEDGTSVYSADFTNITTLTGGYHTIFVKNERKFPDIMNKMKYDYSIDQYLVVCLPKNKQKQLIINYYSRYFTSLGTLQTASYHGYTEVPLNERREDQLWNLVERATDEVERKISARVCELKGYYEW